MKNFVTARERLAKGAVLAYPTEAVYGLGCDPFNEAAVYRLLSLKDRKIEKGLILLIARWEQLDDLIAPLPASAMVAVRATWPGPVTWVFPSKKTLPSWITGDHQSIAVRMTAHPVAKALCLNHPLVSTSANKSGLAPARSVDDLQAQFPVGLDGWVKGALGDAVLPSTIVDVLTGKVLR
ncbi:MAG: L-threonylcarbamoyladenylate synthase [Legionellaceae bacterium]